MNFLLAFFLIWVAVARGEVLDNRDTCAHRVVNCDFEIDHFETKISMEYSSSVTRLEYANTHVLLEQSWPTRGPWMKATNQKVIFVRCGCPVPAISLDWAGANIIFVPVSSMMGQMPNALSKMYLMGQRSKVVAIESTRFISEGIPEAVTDLRDGTVFSLDRALNGKPSTVIKLSFSGGSFSDNSKGFLLRLVDSNCSGNNGNCILKETSCIYPTTDDIMRTDEILNQALGDFNSVPMWVDGGDFWILTKGDASKEPTTLSYEIYFDSQLPMTLDIQGDAASCGGTNIEVVVVRDVASSRRPIYHRLHNLPGGFPDVLITEPRSLGPLADDPKVLARQFLDADPGEESPLGRAELMKLTALIVGSESTGNSMFELIKTRYMRAKEIAMSARHRPTVMVGKPGTWNEAARNSWMITVGSTYVGQFLRDANVEYRNSDDSINEKVCGTGCGVCPSGTSDTRCSVPIDQYLELFRWADYWISAGIGANCWSGSCNFEITADSLLDQNREVFSQFLPMRCGSILALDKAHGVSGNNAYWDVGRLRPDLILEDLVSLMHPDVEIAGETVFFRTLPPPTNLSGVEACPRTLLPPKPEAGTVYVTASYILGTSPPSSEEIMGAPEFVIFDKLYSSVNTAVANALEIEDNDMEIRMLNSKNDLGFFPFVVTVGVSDCQDHKCGVAIGQKLDTLGPVIDQALGISLDTEAQRISSLPVLLLDHEDDRIPLSDLLVEDKEPEKPSTEDTSSRAGESNRDGSSKPNVDGVNSVALGIGVGVAVSVYIVSIVITYKIASNRGKDQNDESVPHFEERQTHVDI